MPVVSSTSFPSAGDCFTLIRALLSDADVPDIQIVSSTGAVRASNGVTISTTNAHNLQVGNIIQLANVYDISFNGTFQIDSVPSPTTFTYPQVAPDASSGNGTVSNIIQGDVYTNIVLLPFVNSAYRKVQSRLLQTGSKTTTGIAVLNLPVGATEISDSSDPQLPVDFIAPRIIQERITGQQFFGGEMMQVNVIPSQPQQAYNYLFSWNDESILFPGSLNSMDIQIRYFKGALNVLTDASSTILIRGSVDAISNWGAYIAGRSRGNSMNIQLKNDFEEAMHELQNMQAHSRQYKPARRRNFNSGRGSYRRGNWGSA